MAGIGKKIEGAATKAAKEKVSGEKKGKGTEEARKAAWTRPRKPSRTFSSRRALYRAGARSRKAPRGPSPLPLFTQPRRKENSANFVLTEY